jgi:hypothetical protein
VGALSLSAENRFGLALEVAKQRSDWRQLLPGNVGRPTSLEAPVHLH